MTAEPSADLPRAVLDTNVLWPPSVRARLVQAIDAGRFEGVWSEWIVAELWRGLVLDWLDRRGDTPQSRREMSRSANEMMRILGPRLTLVSFTGTSASPWPKLEANDHPIFATAVASGADYVVSDNTRDFPPGRSGEGGEVVYEWRGVTYVTSDAFLKLVWAGDVPSLDDL